MHYVFNIRCIFSIILLVMSVDFSRPALAISKGYDAPAQVILKNGTPCFFAKMPTEQPTLPGQTIMVFENRGIMPTIWHINERTGTLPLASSAARCVKYGTSWPTAITKTGPIPLQYDIPYLARIETAAGNGVSFQVEFCLLENVHGKPLLTEWTHDGKHCTNKPLNDSDKPSIWERIFGSE